MKRRARGNLFVPAKAGIQTAAESMRWRALLLTTVAAGALGTAAPYGAEAGPGPCVVGPANVVTCSGNHSAGIDAGLDFDLPPATQIDTLVVNNLTQNIGPLVDGDGIRFAPGSGFQGNAINIISNTGSFEIVVTQTGINAFNASGAPITVNHTGNIQAGGRGILANVVGVNGDAGAASVSMAGNIVSGGTGISAHSDVQSGNGNSAAVSVIFSGNIATDSVGISASSAVSEGNGNAGAVSIESTGNIQGGILARSTVALNGDTGPVTVDHQGLMSDGGISALSTVGGNGNSGSVSISSSGAIFGQINALSSVGGIGDAGGVSITSAGNITATGVDGIFAQSRAGGSGNAGVVDVSSSGVISALGGNASGIQAQSFAEGVGNASAVTVTQAGDIFSGRIGIQISSLSNEGSGGAATLDFTGNMLAEESGIFVQSIGGVASGEARVTITGNVTANSSIGILASSRTLGAIGNAGNATIQITGNVTSVGTALDAQSLANIDGNAGTASVVSTGNIVSMASGGIRAISEVSVDGNAGAATVTSTGNINAGATGILAESRVGGNGDAGDVTVTNTGNITAGGNGIEATSRDGGTGSAGNVTVSSTGSISNALVGILGRSSSSGGGTAGNISVTVDGGTVSGSTAAVQFIEGVSNSLTVGASATVTSLGTAILGGTGNDIIENLGTVTGNVNLSAGNNAFANNAGALFNAGAIVNLGAGNLLQNNGTLAPGGNGTTLTSQLTGDLVLANGGTFAVDVSAGAADRLDGSGTATLGGRVLPIVRGLISATQEFTILTAAGGVNDNGITVTDTAIFDFELRTTPTELILSVTTDFTPANADLTPNQRAVADHLQGVVAAGGGTLGDLIAYLGSFVDPAAFAAALDRLHPEPYLAQLKSVLYSSLGFTDAMQSCPVNAGPNVAATLVEGQCAWARVGGRALEVDRSRENIGFTDQSWGGSAGVQFNLAPNWLGSVAVGYDRSNIKVDDRATASGDVLQIGAGAKYSTGAWRFSGALTAGMASYDTTRLAVMPGINASGDADMHFVGGRLRAEHVFGTNASYIKPLVDLDAVVVRRGGLTETGAGPAGLNVRGQTDAFFSIAPAVEIGGQFSYASGALLRPFLRAGVRLFSDDDLSASATFLGSPAGVPAFTATTPLGQWVGEISTGLDFLNGDRWDARISYDGRFAERTTQHGGNIKLRARF